MRTSPQFYRLFLVRQKLACVTMVDVDVGINVGAGVGAGVGVSTGH